MTTTDATGTDLTTARTRRQAPWPVRISLLDEDGRGLVEADVLGRASDGCMLLDEVAEPNVLLAYYFGKARRRLMVDLGDVVVDGWLETRWDGTARSWWVEPGEEPTS
jgi:hypothetical protein